MDFVICISVNAFRLLPYIVNNVGFVFTNEDLVEVREKLLANKKRAPARAGAIAPCGVTIPAQNTGLGPEKTSFFQALQIPTKISRGTIEIVVSKELKDIVHGSHVDVGNDETERKFRFCFRINK